MLANSLPYPCFIFIINIWHSVALHLAGDKGLGTFIRKRHCLNPALAIRLSPTVPINPSIGSWSGLVNCQPSDMREALRTMHEELNKMFITFAKDQRSPKHALLILRLSHKGWTLKSCYSAEHGFTLWSLSYPWICCVGDLIYSILPFICSGFVLLDPSKSTTCIYTFIRKKQKVGGALKTGDQSKISCK